MSFQKTLKALSDPTRRKIMDLLKEGNLTAGEITEQFSISGASISHHLSILKDANLVLDEKKGKYIYYEINATVLDEVIAWFQELRNDNE
ncbi:MAG: autorepressor SdpR family transcription factor [Clostridia bacterium]